MPVYVVTYDLITKAGEKRDYQPIWDAIGHFPNHEVLYSVFLVEAPSAANIEENIKAALRNDDRYFVSRMRPGEYKYRAMSGTNQWLADHPPG